MVVDHIENHAKTLFVRAIHECAKVVGAAVPMVRREKIDTIVAPSEASGKLRDRHDLEHRDAESGKLRELVRRGRERSFARERSDVNLIDHLPLRADAAPGAIRPAKRRWVDDLRCTV